MAAVCFAILSVATRYWSYMTGNISFSPKSAYFRIGKGDSIISVEFRLAQKLSDPSGQL